MLRAGVDRVVVGAREPADHAGLLFDERVEIVSRNACRIVRQRGLRPVTSASSSPATSRSWCPNDAFEPTRADRRRATSGCRPCRTGATSPATSAFPIRTRPRATSRATSTNARAPIGCADERPTRSPASIPLARGPLVAISRIGDHRMRPADRGAVRRSVRRRRRVRPACLVLGGFTPVLDPTTYVVRPFDLADPGEPTVDLAAARVNGCTIATRSSRTSTIGSSPTPRVRCHRPTGSPGLPRSACGSSSTAASWVRWRPGLR